MPEVAGCQTIIGLEIHVQLKTASKLFCGCAVHTDAPPNTLVCPVCLGHPGALPVLNQEAVRMAVVAGLALNCEIASITRWDRKGYAYPDLPKNYQISQYDRPIASGGYLDIEVDDQHQQIRFRRAHLEEDAGKNLHDQPGVTLVDLNRAGTPLLEIVTEPEISSAEQAYACCTQLQLLMVHLGISDGVMQQGHMRFEPNVNLRITDDHGGEHLTPIVEIKNLNSFRAVKDAIHFEMQRQLDAWQADGHYVLGVAPNENRGWNPDKGITEHQRIKEASHDYRYFPEPDLLEVTIERTWVDELRAALPELPSARQRRWRDQLGLSSDDARTLATSRGSADLFDAVIDQGAPVDVACKQFVNTWLKLAADNNLPVERLSVTAERMAVLAMMTAEGRVNSTSAHLLAETMLQRSDTPEVLANELGCYQINDQSTLGQWVDEALLANPDAVRHALESPKKAKAAVSFLQGQVMQLSGGRANPQTVAQLVADRLSAAGTSDH